MKSYITLYQNEVRAIEITIRDQEELDWLPSNAYVSVRDKNGNFIINETTAMVNDNKIYFIIPTTVTSVVGVYDVLWKIIKVDGSNTYVFYHKTNVIVEEL